jgi:hypothetical protein
MDRDKTVYHLPSSAKRLSLTLQSFSDGAPTASAKATVVEDGGSNRMNEVKEFANPAKRDEQSAIGKKFELGFEVLLILKIWSVCRVARRWSAKPVTAVRLRYRPQVKTPSMLYISKIGFCNLSIFTASSQQIEKLLI